ncbi:hypothetical protein Pelo_16925 [Pelomyxa schiedti]|nr:hypothetical protein Pelo_16925 [Pelomyxa schiedti]
MNSLQQSTVLATGALQDQITMLKAQLADARKVTQSLQDTHDIAMATQRTQFDHLLTKTIEAHDKELANIDEAHSQLISIMKQQIETQQQMCDL